MTERDLFNEPIDTSDERLVWNPLLDYPRNNPCFCDSGRKFKKCCGPQINARISKQDGQKILDSLREFKERES